jgi:hypothetical protein
MTSGAPRPRPAAPSRLRGALDADQRGPCGAQVPDRGRELVLPAGDGLAGAVAAARVMVDVLPAGRAPGVRPGVGGGIDREPQPPPPRARLPHLGGLDCGHAGQRLLQQAVVDHIVLADPLAPLRPVDQLRQRPGQQRRELLLLDPPGGQRVIQRAVPAGELRLQRQLHQRRHRVIGAQDRVAQLEQRIRPRGQALIQLQAELPQRLVRPVPRDRIRDPGRIRRLRRRAQGRTGIQDGLQLACSWEGIQHGRFLPCRGCVPTPA